MIKSIKKVVVVGLTAAMTMSLLTSCGTKKSGSGEKYKIGVIQLTEHVALDQANKGFCDRLEELGIEAEIDQKNAQGEQSTCATIASKFVNDDKDMVLAIATPAAQAIAGATTDIPIVVTAVTDPADSGLVDSNEKPGTNVTGTSDLTPVKQQMELLVKLLPEAKTVGILYCSAEDNSKFQADIAKKEIANLGLNSKEYTVSNSNEIQTVVQSMVGEVDVIYAPTDNMIAAGMATVSMVATENKIPIIVGEEGMCNNGGLATYGIDYYKLGQKTADMAKEILEDGKDPAEMPIQYLSVDECTLTVNQEIADELGIDTSVLDEDLATEE